MARIALRKSWTSYLLACSILCQVSQSLIPLRPPCVPLNVVSPYQSTWSCADNLFDAAPQHWTGSEISMIGFIMVDDVLYRFMGANVAGEKVAVQKSVQVLPTTTIYDFSAGAVDFELRLVTPAIGLDTDIVLSSRPITHVSFSLMSSDKKRHDVKLYIDSSAEGSIHKSDENVTWSRLGDKASKLHALQIGTVDQRTLGQTSDSINWGYWILATPKDAPGVHTVMHSAKTCRSSFATKSYFSLKDDESGPREASKHQPVLSIGWEVALAADRRESRHFMLAYDQVLSMSFFDTNMAPLWRHHWQSALAMLEEADGRRDTDIADTAAFDKELIANLTAAGGDKYAALASLAYRQVTGGTQAVWNPVLKKPWVFIKEISSDGDVSTVDVVYPAFPMFQYLYPEYFRLMLMPLMVYGNNETKAYGKDIPYNLAWAPHHLGAWPICDILPNQQEQMPVEESGNMLIMLAGLYKAQKAFEYLDPYWPMLNTWADFIVASLPDPGNQLCTDDFEGPSPHNTNLAAKGIVALEAYAGLLRAKGEKDSAEKYRQHAFAFAKNWTATAKDGDHYRIQFNKPGTWSQKYNLLWQKVLGLKAFPEDVFKLESSFYQGQLKSCGVALDDRHPYTKSDWSLWAASMSETQEQFDTIVSRVFKFANTTESRVPLSDWYDVNSCKSVGFRARPVQGGLFAKMLVPPVPPQRLPTPTAAEIVI